MLTKFFTFTNQSIQGRPPGRGYVAAAEGDYQDERQHEETLEVGVEVVEPGGEAGEVGGEVGLRPAGEEDAGRGGEVCHLAYGVMGKLLIEEFQ